MEIIEEFKAGKLLMENRIKALETTVLELTKRIGIMENQNGISRAQQPNLSGTSERKDERTVTSLVISDSNRKYISPAGLSFGERKTLIYPCSKLENVENVIKERNVEDKKINPDTVLVSSGTNDWDDADGENLVITRLETSIVKVKEMWPQARIKISEILPRKDKSMAEMDSMNEKIRKTTENHGLEFQKFRITHEDLVDNKHVSKETAYKLALGWKFAVNPRESWRKSRNSSTGQGFNVTSVHGFRTMLNDFAERLKHFN